MTRTPSSQSHKEEIKCSRSWDDKWWFFFCNKCKNVRPHIIGVLRGVRIYLYMEHTDYITDSENSSWYCSSESEIDSTQENIEDHSGPYK